MRESSITVMTISTQVVALLLWISLAASFVPVPLKAITVQQQQQQQQQQQLVSVLGERAAAFLPRRKCLYDYMKSCSTRLFAKQDRSEDDDEDDDDEDSNIIGLEVDADWRDFRARLVMGESAKKQSKGSSSASSTKVRTEGDLDGIGSLFEEQIIPSVVSQSIEEGTGMTPLDPSQWAYDSGNVIEQGAIILGGVEQEFGFGLRQQYFHKAAILVLDHEENTFTKGIILNRPTDLTLDDDINEGVKWRVWFGGDVQGLTSSNPGTLSYKVVLNMTSFTYVQDDLIPLTQLPLLCFVLKRHCLSSFNKQRKDD
jgi:hypothetical protein